MTDIHHLKAPALLAEMAGAEVAIRALNAMLAVGNQAERFRILKAMLLDLADTSHPAATMGGAAGQLVNVLEIGLGLDTLTHADPEDGPEVGG